MLELHRSQAQIDECLAAHGLRPIERLWKLGLLTPALNAVHAVHLNAADIALAQRTGISISLCPQSNLRLGDGLPPLAALAAAHIRLGVGGGGGAHLSQDLWGNIKLIALMMQGARAASGTERATGDESGSERGDESGSERGAGGDAALCAWEALRLATHGGAMVLGKEAEIGTLEGGKWADVCCVDLSGPNAQPLVDPLEQLVFGGGRDSVSDVWVAGRQLLSGGELTRLDWPALTRAPLRSAANSGS
jgi:5-methylthioadenosine/S-adenosylhomocysteine deaminase